MGFRALKKTEQEAVIKSRIGQGMFRGGVELLWNRRCAVTGVRAINLLVASHIKPWKKSTNRQKLNPYNGLLLVPNLDKAFDKGMISFDDGGHIIVSARLSEEDAAILGITKRLKLCKVSAETKKYLRYHRRHVYLGGVR
jgi:predicted restriction endonuclease